MPFAGSKRSTMAVVPTRHQSGHVKKQKSGSDGYVRSDCKLCIGATIGTKKARRIDAGQTFSQKSSGSRWAGSLSDFSGSETSRASSKRNSARIASQESKFPAAPQQSNTGESVAQATIRGFMVRTAKKLPEFLERRASPSNATIENMVAIKESRLDGDALIITVKAEDLPKITRLNGVLFAGAPLMIRPYRAKSSIPESPVDLAKGTVVSQTELSAQVPNAGCPQLAPLVSQDRTQTVDIAIPTSPYTESSKPEVDPNPLPVCNSLAATAPPECLQQKPELEEHEVTTTSTLAITEVAKEAIAVQLCNITGISLPISHLCLSQSDYDQAIALEAINFAADFASPNGLALQASILCLDNSLWNMEHAALVAGAVVKEVSEKTGMTMDWAIEFLYANGWTVKEALEGFEAVKDLLPREAFKE